MSDSFMGIKTAPYRWMRVSHSAKREVQPCKLFVEKSWLRCSDGSGRFAASDADDAKHGQFDEGITGNKNAVRGGVQVWRSDLDAVVEDRKEIVGDDAFQSFPVSVAQANPKSLELGTTEEGFAFQFEVVREVADKIDGANPGEGNLLVLAVGGKQVNGVGMAEASGIEITAEGRFVGEDNDDLLVSRGWGAVSQRNQSAKVRKGRNLRIIKMYVMLSALFLSTYCFH
jgi:hypothetical protein